MIQFKVENNPISMTVERVAVVGEGAYEKGYDKGYADGETVGYEKGYGEGETVGYNKGTSDGYTTGYEKGNSDGYANGYETGYAEGGKYFTTPTGYCYVPDMVIPNLEGSANANQYLRRWQNFVNLRSIEVSGGVVSWLQESILEGNVNLERAILNNFQRLGHYAFRDCTALKEAQLGSIGIPFMDATTLSFYNCRQSGLVITAYVSDDDVLPMANSPWGATNATIIYRSATTGEVIEL